MGSLKYVALVGIAAFVTYWLLSDHQPPDLADLLRGKNVVVTGASSGIGKQAAIFYAKQGANVVVIARREALLKEVVKQCYKASPMPESIAKFHYIVADFSDVENSEKVMLEAIALLGGSLDYLMLNHALLPNSADNIGRWTGNPVNHEWMEKSLDVNFLSFVRMAGTALPTLKTSNGSICAISTMGVEVPMFVIPHAVSKSAVNTFFTGLRQELLHQKENVSVTLVHLGAVQTEQADQTIEYIYKALGRPHVSVMIQNMPKTSPEAAAAEIVSVTARRRADVYYPYDQWLWVIRVARLLTARIDEYILKFENYINGW